MYSHQVQCRLAVDALGEALVAAWPISRPPGSRVFARLGSARDGRLIALAFGSTNDFGHPPVQPDPSPNPLPAYPIAKDSGELLSSVYQNSRHPLTQPSPRSTGARATD